MTWLISISQMFPYEIERLRLKKDYPSLEVTSSVSIQTQSLSRQQLEQKKRNCFYSYLL